MWGKIKTKLHIGGAKIKFSYHEVWRRYHNLRYMKHRRKHSVHLAKRRHASTDAMGRPRVREGT